MRLYVASQKIRQQPLPFVRRTGIYLPVRRRDREALQPSLGVSSLDLGRRQRRPFFLSGPFHSAAERIVLSKDRAAASKASASRSMFPAVRPNAAERVWRRSSM